MGRNNVNKSRSRSSEINQTRKELRDESKPCKRHRSTSSSPESSPSPKRKKLKGSSKKCKARSKRKKKLSSSSSSSSSSNSCSESSGESSKRKKKRLGKKQRKKEKRKLLKKEKRRRQKKLTEENVDQLLADSLQAVAPKEEVLDRSRAMAPMTREEWEKRQAVVRKVYDEATGRHRLVKGDGEIVEEIVSRERHQDINRQATQSDGNYFQARLGTNQPCK